MRKSRRKARESALRALYEMEIGKVRVGDALEEMTGNAELNPDLMQFANQLVAGVHEKQAFLDDKLAARIREYQLERIAAVDRNLLRIAAYELYFCDEIPPIVSINEAIELAKKYSTAESGKFVNGVLAHLMEDSPKAHWDPTAHVQEFEETAPSEEQPEVETIEEGTPEAKELARIGLWKTRSREDGS
jgi:N utilization substance protein B